jgi:DNA-binding response OmpR family regulator
LPLKGGMDEREMTVLVVEDDERTAAFLADNLRADGFRVAVAGEAGEALRAIEVRKPDAVVLDLSLEAGSSGLAVLDGIRSADGLGSRIDPDLPVIMLTGRSAETDRVRAFERGTDDFVTKPFFYSELIARLRALLRRSSGRRGAGMLRVGDLTVDPGSRTVRMGDRTVELSAKEFALLHALARDPQRVFTKHELLRDVWGYLAIGATRTVDAHACRLRKKLGGRRWIVSVRGVGYKLVEVVA